VENVTVAAGFKFDLKENLPENHKAKRKPPKMTPLIVAGDNVPVVFTLKRGSWTDLVLTFSIVNDKDEFNTNLALKPSFVVFCSNVIDVLAKGAVQKDGK
jgi:hypothetical protein